MRVFDTKGLRLKELDEDPFPLENKLHTLIEENLESLFGLEYIRSQFELQGFRIDTLAFDKESRSFVIMEYKRGKDFQVVEQGMAYLNLMLNNKAEAILEYNQKHAPGLRKNDVDWSQSRVIFIAREFSKYQQHAIGFRLGIQLWEIHRYKNGLLVLQEVKPVQSKEPITTFAKSNDVAKKLSEEIRVYTEDDHLKTCDDKVRETYFELKSQVLSLGNDIEVRPTAKYVAFRTNKQFLGVVFLREKLKAYLDIDTNLLEDPLKRARNMKGIGHFSKGNTELTVEGVNDVPLAVSLIKQAYEKTRTRSAD